MNALNDTKTSELSKSAEGNREYLSVAFVEVWIKCNFPNGITGLKNHANVAKNKACTMCVSLGVPENYTKRQSSDANVPSPQPPCFFGANI